MPNAETFNGSEESDAVVVVVVEVVRLLFSNFFFLTIYTNLMTKPFALPRPLEPHVPEHILLTKNKIRKSNCSRVRRGRQTPSL